MPAFALPLLAAALTPGNGLAMFDPLVGKCWEGAPAEGARDVHCFEAVYGGAHVRDRHRVYAGGEVVYEGETLYSREGAEVTFVYLNSLGGVGRGTASPSENGICFKLTMRADPDAAPQEQATCWRWQPSGYLVEAASGQPVRFLPSETRF